MLLLPVYSGKTEGLLCFADGQPAPVGVVAEGLAAVGSPHPAFRADGGGIFAGNRTALPVYPALPGLGTG